VSEKNGYDIAEIERWLFNYFTVGMPEINVTVGKTHVVGFPWLPGTEPPDRNHLFWSMVRHFGNDVRPIMMRSPIWTFH
jgi:hypothetical protein